VILVIAEYIRGLKERHELDALLPILLHSMGIIPIAKPQGGVRQFGVDFNAAGVDPVDGRKKLFLFTIKKGDIGRSAWLATDPQSIQNSLSEIVLGYAHANISNEHQHLPKVIVLAYSGDWRQDAEQVWKGYITKNQCEFSFQRWGADYIAFLMQKFLLNEHLFQGDAVPLLRQALANAGAADLEPNGLYQVLLSSLELTSNGTPSCAKTKIKGRTKGALAANLAIELYRKYALEQGNAKTGLVASERGLLWQWQRVMGLDLRVIRKCQSLNLALASYVESSDVFLRKMSPYYQVKNGVGLQCAEHALLSGLLFENIGLLATRGLYEAFASENADLKSGAGGTRNEIAASLLNLILNNPSASSPRLDEQTIDVNLALLFLTQAGLRSAAISWLENLVLRIDFVFKHPELKLFPARSLRYLVETTQFYEPDNHLSLMLPTLADWCVLLGQNELYDILAKRGVKLSWVNKQLWHAEKSIFDSLYFENPMTKNGATEASIEFPQDQTLYKKRIESFQQFDSPFNLRGLSCAANKKLPFLDFLACRHFRCLVPPYMIYSNVAPV